MYISDVLRTKGSEVVTVGPETSVREFVNVLVDRAIGACVISEDGRTIAGIISERDVATGLAARGEHVLDEPVSTIGIREVYTAEPGTTLHDVMALMTRRRVRHVPILVDGELVGLVSLGDIVKYRLDELESERQHLVDYISSAG